MRLISLPILLGFIFQILGNRSLALDLHLHSDSSADSAKIIVAAGWNMITLPLFVADPRISTVFPSAISQAFYYDGSYQRTNTLKINVGYWLKFASPETITVTGTKQHLGVCTLAPGWNLIGGNSYSTPISQLMLSPSGSTRSRLWTVGQNGEYLIPDTIIPGRSYWVKSMGVTSLALAHWEFVGLQGKAVTSIVSHPKNPNTLYCGTGSDFSAGQLGGVFKTTDGGASWDTLVIGGSYSDMAIDEAHPETLYAVSGSILMTPDGGTTWQTRTDSIYLNPETRVQALAIDPANSSTMYAGTTGFYGGNFYKSTNAGISWNSLASREDSLLEGISSIAIDPQHNSTLYVGLGIIGDMLKSNDAGNTWSYSGFDGFGQLINDIIINPKETQRLIAALSYYGFVETNDGGSNWRWFNDGIPSPVYGRRVIIDDSTENIYSVADSGIYMRMLGDPYWLRIGVPQYSTIFGYSGFAFNASHQFLFVGSFAGVYRLQLP